MFGNSSTGFKPFIPSMFSGVNLNIDSWKTIYTASTNDEPNQKQNVPQMYNCIFKTSEGRKFVIPFKESRTAEDLILTFFRRVDKENLFQEGGIAFLYNASLIDYHDKSPIKNIFRFNLYPAIVVIDIRGLIGA